MMGRQIEFIHTEEDIASFLLEIERNGGYFIHNQFACPAPALAEMILSQMATPLCKLYIAPNGYVGNNKVEMDIHHGTVIEFLNCRKGNSLSRIYEIGRLYVTHSSASAYDSDAILLFNKLREYINANYFYSKKAKIYYSASFKAQYEQKYYYASRLGRLFDL